MNNFNKLYNLILESIINLNRASRAQMLAKLPNHLLIENYLNTLDNKVADFLAKYFKSGLIIDINDKRIANVIDILKRNTTFNIQTKISLDLFLKQNEEYISRALNKEMGEDIISYIDNNIEQFRLKKEYPNGVVIYLVDNTKAGQLAVRKIIDICYGKEANPWCLASRGGEGLEVNFTKFYMGTYNAYPKHIAFQDGQLIGFCAGQSPTFNEWWDRLDQSSSSRVKLLDGTYMQTERYYWTPEKRLKQFLLGGNLVYNEKTDRYDAPGDVKVRSVDVVNGHFPVKFGVINGNFDCNRCTNLRSLDGAPTEVKGIINYDGCTGLPQEVRDQYLNNRFFISNKLKYNEETGKYDSSGNVRIKAKDLVRGFFPVLFGVINGNFDCTNLKTLKSLKGAPTEVKGKTYYRGCIRLPNAEQVILDSFIKNNNLVLNELTSKYDSNSNIKITNEDLINGKFPLSFGVVKGNFDCSLCNELSSLEGAPEYVGGDFNLRNCGRISSLIGGPKRVEGSVELALCRLTSLEGAPEYVGKNFNCSYSGRMKNLIGGPKYVGRNYNADNWGLTSLLGIADYIGGELSYEPGIVTNVPLLIKQKYKLNKKIKNWKPSEPTNN